MLYKVEDDRSLAIGGFQSIILHRGNGMEAEENFFWCVCCMSLG